MCFQRSTPRVRSPVHRREAPALAPAPGPRGCSSAICVTGTPSARAVSAVTGPMHAVVTFASAAAPTASTRCCTVEELVKVTASIAGGKLRADLLGGGGVGQRLIDRKNAHPGAALGEALRQHLARHARPWDENPLAGRGFRELLYCPLGHVTVGLEVDAQAAFFHGGRRRRADGADACRADGAHVLPRARQALEEVTHPLALVNRIQS